MAKRKKEAGDAKPQDQEQLQETGAAEAAGAGATEATTGDQHEAPMGAGVSSAEALDPWEGQVLPGDGSTAETPADPDQPQEIPAADADTGQSADAGPGDSPAPDAAGTADVPAAANLDDGEAGALVPGLIDPDYVYPRGEPVAEDLATLTTDMPLWAGFRAQRAVARALANDQDAAHISFEQCAQFAWLLRKSPGASIGALEMQLKLNELDLEIEPPLSGALVNAFREAFKAVLEYQRLKAAMEAQRAKARQSS